MHPEFLIRGLEDQHEEPFVGCLFCCQPFRWNYSRTKNVDSKFDLFCQAFHLTEDSFKVGLRMSPLCPNCLGLIQRIGKMLKRIQELETKLNLEKEAVINLLREEYGTLSSPEGQHPQNFSPVQFRGDIQKRLSIVPRTCIKEEICPASVVSIVELEPEPLFYPEGNEGDQVDEVDEGIEEEVPRIPLDLTSPEDRVSLADGGDEKSQEILRDVPGLDPRFLETPCPEEVEETVKVEPIVKYCLPAGVVLKDCSIRLETVENPRKRGRGRSKKVGTGESKPRQEAKELKKIKTKKTKKRKISQDSDVDRETLDWGDESQGKMKKPKKGKNTDRPKIGDIPCTCPEAGEGKCTRIFSIPEEKDLRREHRKEVQKRRTTCTDCNLTFESIYHLMKHRVRTHGDPFPIQCPEEGCRQGVLNKRLLTEHMYIHTGEYPYRCEHCNAGYPSLPRLNEHLLTHTTRTDFVCEVCGKAFKSQKILRAHYRSHTDDRPWKCELCGQAFKILGALTSHMRTKHSDARPFLCQDCGKAFKQKFVMEQHFMAKHQGIKLKRPKKSPGSSSTHSDPNSSAAEAEADTELNLTIPNELQF